MSSNEEIIQRIEHKKQLLLEQKCLYSQVTDELSAENQLHFRMSKALKQQNINIKRKTKKYIDNCVQRALFEAELEYSTEILKNITNPTEYNKEVEEVNHCREKLSQYLEDYRQCRQQFFSTRKAVTNESTRVKQSCLDTAFYCQDLKTKLSHDLKKSLHSNINYETIKRTQQHHKHLNESISLIADRVLDSRQELKGYFKNQIMKLQREQRILEETEAANKLREKKIAEETGMSTKEEIERYLKANKLFGADKEETGGGAGGGGNQATQHHGSGSESHSSSPRPGSVPTTPNSKLTPRPPVAPLMSSVSPRVGNLVTMTAASKRKIRGTQSTAMNLDEICEELLQVCQLDGKKHRLESLKKMLQSHVMSQLCLLTLVQSDLLKINEQFATSTATKAAAAATDLPPPPPYPPSLQQENSSNTNQSERDGGRTGAGAGASGSSGGQIPAVASSKTKKPVVRHVYLKDNLRMEDEDEEEDEYHPKKMQYLSTGLSYAQSLCFEIEALEAEVTRLNQLNESTLHSHSHQSHEKHQIEEIKRQHENSVQRLSLLAREESEDPEDEFHSEQQLMAPPSLPPSQTNSPARHTRKTLTGPSEEQQKHATAKPKFKGMQSEMISHLNKQKERDRERELKFKEEKNKQRKRLFSDDIEENGITSWCKDDKLKKMFIDILVSELNSSPAIPLELGFVKLASMNLMSLEDPQDSTVEDTHHHPHPHPPRQGHHHQQPPRRKSSSSTSAQHRVLLIEGLGSL